MKRLWKGLLGAVLGSTLLVAGIAKAHTIAVYVDGMRVGSYETNDPLWWWAWNPWAHPLFDNWNLSPTGGPVIVAGLAEGTVGTVLASADLGAGPAVLRKLLKFDENVKLYAYPAAQGKPSDKAREDVGDFVAIEVSDATIEALAARGEITHDDLLKLADDGELRSVTLITNDKEAKCGGEGTPITADDLYFGCQFNSK